MNKIAIGIHYDSLGEVINFPDNYRDPTFFAVLDRFLEFSNRRKFSYTIYVIGNDLKNEANAARIKECSQMGHEIGSHSWSHHVDLSLLQKEEVHDQIYKAHEIIHRTTGLEPTGFAAPGWAWSHEVWNRLISLNYRYDTSVFASWLMVPQYAYWVINYIGSPKFSRFFRRGKDIMNSVFAPKDPFTFYGDCGVLHILPLPVTRMGMAFWHSLGFIIGWDAHFRLLRQCLKENKVFYYIMHAGDMIDPSDLNNGSFSRRMPRTKVSSKEKKQIFERILDIFEENGKEIVTFHELAGEVFPRQERTMPK